MILANKNYSSLKESYLFSTIATKVAQYGTSHPDARLIRLGIGDVTLPLPPAITNAMHTAVDEMGIAESFRGYGPEQGYEFLRRAIASTDYHSRAIDIDASEIFISDGAKSDLGNFTDLLDPENIIALTDPVYPVYADTNLMDGREIVFLACTPDNGFIPQLPAKKVDVIYLCYPNNPTGTTLSSDELQKWVDYARVNNALILYDSAYEAYITEANVPHSIFEIQGAKEVAVEFRSFSKSAGFTGVRCGYTVVPNQLKCKDSTGKTVDLHKMWNRRQCTKFNGVSYIVQRGAEAIYSELGQRQTRENIDYYLNNAQILLKGLTGAGFLVYGGTNAPYLWVKTPDRLSSWEFFDILLDKYHIVATPGAGFGTSGEGFIRMTAFGRKEDCIEAIERINTLKL